MQSAAHSCYYSRSLFAIRHFFLFASVLYSSPLTIISHLFLFSFSSPSLTPPCLLLFQFATHHFARTPVLYCRVSRCKHRRIWRQPGRERFWSLRTRLPLIRMLDCNPHSPNQRQYDFQGSPPSGHSCRHPRTTPHQSPIRRQHRQRRPSIPTQRRLGKHSPSIPGSAIQHGQTQLLVFGRLERP